MLDRRSFLQFLCLTESSTIPDGRTTSLFRDRLAQAGLGTKLFDQVQQQLLANGYRVALRPDDRRFAGTGTGPAQPA